MPGPGIQSNTRYSIRIAIECCTEVLSPVLHTRCGVLVSCLTCSHGRLQHYYHYCLVLASDECGVVRLRVSVLVRCGLCVHMRMHSGETNQVHRERVPVDVPVDVCYTEKATPARHRPERQHNARSNRRKQCSPNGTKPYSNPTPPRKRQTTPTNGHTPRRMKPTHKRLTYTRMRPHAPSHQAGDHPVPAHTERHNPPRLRTQRQSGLPPRPPDCGVIGKLT